jgi:hypothetical protein
MKMITKRNPDYDTYCKITEAVRNNDGYCPCAIVKSPDTLCPCKDFREQDYEGECHCGRFIKEVADE